MSFVLARISFACSLGSAGGARWGGVLTSAGTPQDANVCDDPRTSCLGDRTNRADGRRSRKWRCAQLPAPARVVPPTRLPPTGQIGARRRGAGRAAGRRRSYGIHGDPRGTVNPRDAPRQPQTDLPPDCSPWTPRSNPEGTKQATLERHFNCCSRMGHSLAPSSQHFIPRSDSWLACK